MKKDKFGPELLIEVHRPDIGLDGYLVIDNTKLGPGKGGLRMHKDVTRSEVMQLARSMSLKTALADLPFGGAKAGIVWDHTDNKRQLFEAFIEEIKYLMPEKYISAPDISTGSEEMKWLIDITGEASTATGKAPEDGGIEYKEPSTGFGVCIAANAAAEFIGLSLAGSKVAVDGYGMVGGWTARYLHERGASIVATSSRHGGIYNPEGIDLEKLDNIKSEGNTVKEYTDAQDITHDELLQLDVDILITASVSNIVNENNYTDIKAPLIVEGSNLPMSHDIEQKLHENGIVIVPDIVANAGGVIASYIEYADGDKSKDHTQATIAEKIKKSVCSVLETSKHRSEYPRAAALELAEEKLES